MPLAEAARRISEIGNTVRFDALKNGTAKPYKMLWICGLNEGAFPRNEYRTAFDLIGQHPTMMDVVARDQDAFAFLKAVSSVTDFIAFSYQGKDPRSKEEKPPSVLLTEMIDYVKRNMTDVKVALYEHPLQAFSYKYFCGGNDGKLPANFSRTDYLVAKRLHEATENVDAVEAQSGFLPFSFSDDVTDIEISELADYVVSPDYFIRKERLKVARDYSRMNQISDDEALSYEMDKKTWSDLCLKGTITSETISNLAMQAREDSGEIDVKALENFFSVECSRPILSKFYLKTLKYCDNSVSAAKTSCVEAYGRCLDMEKTSVVSPVLNVNGHRVRLVGNARFIELACDDGERRKRFVNIKMLYDNSDFDALIRLTHLAGNAAGMDFITDVLAVPKTNATSLSIYALKNLDAAAATEKLEAFLTDALGNYEKDAQLFDGLEKICADIRITTQNRKGAKGE